MSELNTITIGRRTALVTVSDKLRGRVARSLGERLRELADGGYRRVVIHLDAPGCMDSCGEWALEEGVERGLRLHLVVRPATALGPFVVAKALLERGVAIHRGLQEALDRVRDVIDSGRQPLVV